MTIYEFSDTTAEHDLAAAAKRGVRVRVILDRRARSVNAHAYSYLRSHRVAVNWSSRHYRYTHQKTVIIDGTKAVIMTANLTSRYYATWRDFLVTDTEQADVSAITAVFEADFAGKAVRPGDGSDLVLVAHQLAGPAARPHQRRDQQPAHLQRGDGRPDSGGGLPERQALVLDVRFWL